VISTGKELFMHWKGTEERNKGIRGIPTLSHRSGPGMARLQSCCELTCNTLFYSMIKTISKIGNSQGIIFDSALLQLARLKVGDEVNVEVHSGGTITIAPMEPTVIELTKAAETTRRLIAKNSELFRRLARVRPSCILPLMHC